VVIGGCTTEGCVESTARDAMFSDRYVVIADDCVGSDDRRQHDASMLLMRHRFDMASGPDIAAVWHAAATDGQPDNSNRTSAASRANSNDADNSNRQGIR
jgi:isochorismate hydrolase